jgi:hypothetical protein
MGLPPPFTQQIPLEAVVVALTKRVLLGLEETVAVVAVEVALTKT